MSRLGIGSQSTVVIYDDRGGVWAARLWWALRYYGHDNARLLNGGLGSWLAAGYELRQATEIPPQSQFEAVVSSNLRVTKEDVLAGLEESVTDRHHLLRQRNIRIVRSLHTVVDGP